MHPIPGKSDADLARLLRALPRAAPPGLPLDAILDRFEARRRRGIVATGVLGGILLLLGAFLLSPGKSEPPVHLDLYVVDVPSAEGAGPSSLEGPRELSLP